MNTERVQAVHYLTLAAHSEHSTVGESTGWSLRTATTNDAVLTFLGKRSIPRRQARQDRQLRRMGGCRTGLWGGQNPPEIE